LSTHKILDGEPDFLFNLSISREDAIGAPLPSGPPGPGGCSAGAGDLGMSQDGDVVPVLLALLIHCRRRLRKG